MAEKIPMIALSPTMNDGTIVGWKKKEGDPVAVGDVLCVVETDKAAMDYECQSEGILLKILAPAGAQAKVGDTIAILGAAGEDIAALLGPAPAAPAPPAAPAASPGVATPGAVGTPRGAAPVHVPQDGSPTSRVRSSPLARRLAAIRGVDMATVTGSGPGGRVIKRDLEGTAPPRAVPEGAAATAVASGPTQAQAASGLSDEVIPVTGKRKVIAERLTASAFSAPAFTLTLSIEMDGLLAARARINGRRQQKVSLNAFLIKLVAETLRRHPGVNASWQGETIRRFGSVDVGLAVALPDGLITPVVRRCESKGVLAIDAELALLVNKAREGKLAPPEYTGATFTISNLGSFGIEEFTAIINPPGSAILALGKVQKVPVVFAEDRIEVRSAMRATLSCDHRVIDGAVGAAFLAGLKEMIENPYAVLL